uniref:Mediator of RNA polymerase II transcription subunit 7 n=1 Tax=Hanusia phi TaxID=3032 RepID=A0A7S0EY79_9CRYP|mmetsp:Transcript_33316/g.74665  ORF Transcript_33316/g.74665 Transcript_33316/m.74665 type:complete len:350 (+) Transcript_33316:81-1130(+)
MAQNNAAVAPFPPPPKFYEAFEPHSNKQFQCPPPPPPIEGPYVMFGTLYDTSFAPQPPHAALAEKGLELGISESESQSPIAIMRLLNRALPDEYLNLLKLMIERPTLCRSEEDQKKIREIDEQRGKIESIIGAMHLTLSRFRPYQARQALITTLRAQVEKRREEAKQLKECRMKAQALISNASKQLKDAGESFQKANQTKAQILANASAYAKKDAVLPGARTPAPSAGASSSVSATAAAAEKDSATPKEGEQVAKDTTEVKDQRSAKEKCEQETLKRETAKRQKTANILKKLKSLDRNASESEATNVAAAPAAVPAETASMPEAAEESAQAPQAEAADAMEVSTEGGAT